MLTTYYLKLISTGILINAFLPANYQIKPSLKTELQWIFKNKDPGASRKTTRWPVPDCDIYAFTQNYELDFGISASLKHSGIIFYMIDILDVLHTVGEKFTMTLIMFFSTWLSMSFIEQVHIQDVLTQGYSTVDP